MGDSRRFSGEPSVDVGIHQIRKLAASHAIRAGQKEQIIKEKMGFSKVKMLRKKLHCSGSEVKIRLRSPWGHLYSEQGTRSVGIRLGLKLGESL